MDIFRFLSHKPKKEGYKLLEREFETEKKAGNMTGRYVQQKRTGFLTRLIDFLRPGKTRALNEIRLGLRRSAAINSTPPSPDRGNEKFAMPYTREAFDMMTRWRQFPCAGAKELSLLIAEANLVMRTQGGLENIFHNIYLLSQQARSFKATVEKTSEQHIRIISETKFQAVSPEEYDPKTTVELKTMRLEAIDNLQKTLSRSLYKLGPDKLLEKRATLYQHLKNGEITETAYQEELQENMQHLQQKARQLFPLINSRHPEVQIIAKKWLTKIQQESSGKSSMHS